MNGVCRLTIGVNGGLKINNWCEWGLKINNWCEWGFEGRHNSCGPFMMSGLVDLTSTQLTRVGGHWLETNASCPSN